MRLLKWVKRWQWGRSEWIMCKGLLSSRCRLSKYKQLHLHVVCDVIGKLRFELLNCFTISSSGLGEKILKFCHQLYDEENIRSTFLLATMLDLEYQVKIQKNYEHTVISCTIALPILYEQYWLVETSCRVLIPLPNVI